MPADSGRGAIRLLRRGVAHGAVRRGPIRRLPAGEAHRRWESAEPVHLRRALADAPRCRAAVGRTVAVFARLRAGGGFEREVWRRCSGEFVPAGVSVDLGDEREIEKVHADRRRGGRLVARDLWAKLSWISLDPRDASLRIRFSFGAERLDDWRTDPARARAADAFAEAVFPECALLAGDAEIGARLARWNGRSVRFSERIVFSNAPGGGARFHHDAEPGQRGVAYAQLTGSTAWLALPRRALAREVAALARRGGLAAIAGTEAKAARALGRDAPALHALLDRSSRLTRRLVELGALYVLRAGDVLLLPSHGPEEAAWHSVFALGRAPSLAHSFGLFDRLAR